MTGTGPCRHTELEATLQGMFRCRVGTSVAVHWEESREWSGENSRRAVVSGVYPHGMRLLLEGESGDYQIPCWLSWVELWLTPELIETPEIRAELFELVESQFAAWVE